MSDITITPGFSEAERPVAAQLYWQAFGGKLGKVLGPPTRGETFFRRVMNPDFALVARDNDGHMLGLAGFKTREGSLAQGGQRDLMAVYGVIGAFWRAVLLAPLERAVEHDTLLMDGICVSSEARGRGVGTLLLDAIKAEAAARGLSHVRLDVIDSNPRARALYERQGFVTTGEEQTGPLKYVFGFARATTMVFTHP